MDNSNDRNQQVRRALLKAAGFGSLGALLPAIGCGGSDKADESTSFALGHSSTSATALPATGITGRVVVVGGGMAGAAVAKYLRLWGGSGVAVTLVERSASYTSNIMSNLVLTGQRSISSLQYTYNNLVSRYGINRVQGEVVSVDPVGRKVRLASGSTLAYDRLVLAPGVVFTYELGLGGIPGLETAAAQARVLHAWQAGPQTTALRNQITAMPNGGVFVLTIPAKPYRCPPGPYERACLVADWLKKNRPGAKVFILDANPGITAEVHSFTDAFMNVHAGVAEYHPSVVINSIDASAMTLNTSIGNIQANVINAIPPHRAGKVVTDAGLADIGGRWASVNQLSYESKVAGIHVIGDSAGTDQPKAGHIGNQLGKVCADAMLRALGRLTPDPAPVTNSACYSPITMDTASWLTAVFAYNPTTLKMAAVADSFREAESRSGENFSKMNKWFSALMTETFS